ncbi:MAG: hypothetical protein RL344_533 [Pseudomonadota bacterium]
MKKLLTVTLFSGLLTLVRMASGFIIAKVVAVHTGPTGIAMLGQVHSLLSTMNGIVASPAGSGVVRYTAENNSAGLDTCSLWWKASLNWITVLFLAVFLAVFLFAKSLAQWALGNQEYSWLVIVAAISLPLSVAGTLIGSVINGQENYRRFVSLGMISVVLSTCVMVFLIIQYQLDGALLSAALFTSISGLIMLLGSINQPWFKLKYWWGKADKVHLKNIGGYVAMAITSAATVPVSLVLVRNILVDKVGWEQAGHWQAVYKISEVYLGVITIALSTYFLPKLATLKDSQSILLEIKNTAKIVMPIVITMAIIVYFLRDFAISVLFTEAFRPARDLFAIQLVGDVIKILAWLYAYPMLSHGATKLFIFSEVFFSISFVLLTFMLVNIYGVDGANISYVANYAIYFIFVFITANKAIYFKKLL